jgi:hypothetical protein
MQNTQNPIDHGAPQFFSASTVVASALAHFKENAALLMSAALVWFVPMAIFGYLPVTLVSTGALQPESVGYYGVSFGIVVANHVVSAYFSIGFARMGLAIVRGEHPSFGHLFAGRGFGRFLGLSLALAAPGWLGPALEIVGAAAQAPGLHEVATWWGLIWLLPAALLWLPLSQAMYFIFDRGMGPAQAVRASIATTRGKRLGIFLASFLAGLIGVSGVLGCCVGLVATVPLAMMVFPVMYARLTGQDPNADGPAYHPKVAPSTAYLGFDGPPPPAGGFGAPPAR